MITQANAEELKEVKGLHTISAPRTVRSWN